MTVKVDIIKVDTFKVVIKQCKNICHFVLLIDNQKFILIVSYFKNKIDLRIKILLK